MPAVEDVVLRLAAAREAKEKGALALGVVNVVGSTIAREVDAGIYLHAGPEIGVASTKAFTCQCVTLTMLALFMGRRRLMSQQQSQEINEFAEKVMSPKLSTLPGVAQVTINGAQKRAVRIRYDLDALATRGISVEEVRVAVMALALALVLWLLFG